MANNIHTENTSMKDDNWTDHVEPGDWVIDQSMTRERRLKVREITDDGRVRFDNEFGGTGADLASNWQIRWENGDLHVEVTIDDSDGEE